MAPFLGTVLSRYCIGGYMSDETRGREDAAQDAEACAEALESLDRIALDEVTFDETFVDMQDEPRADALALADTEQSASDDAETTPASTLPARMAPTPTTMLRRRMIRPSMTRTRRFSPNPRQMTRRTLTPAKKLRCSAACRPMTRSPASFLAWVLHRPSTRPSPWAIFPCRPFPRHAKPRLAITRCRPSDAI